MKDYQDRVVQADKQAGSSVTRSHGGDITHRLLKEIEQLNRRVGSLENRMSIIRSILGFEPDLGELSAYEIDRIMRQYE